MDRLAPFVLLALLVGCTHRPSYSTYIRGPFFPLCLQSIHLGDDAPQMHAAVLRTDYHYEDKGWLTSYLYHPQRAVIMPADMVHR